MSDEKILPHDEETDETRREWLLRVGEVSALAGMAGLLPDLTTVLAAAQEQPAVGLPPGLYEPATGHLSQVLTAQAAPIIPAGTPTDYVRPRVKPFQPQFFTAAEFPVAQRLVALLLGEVDPQALAETVEWLDLSLHGAAGVRRRIRRLDARQRAVAAAYDSEERVRQLETADWQAVAREGLRALEQRSRERFRRDFLQAPAEGQSDLVREMSAAAPDSPMRRFYDLLRRETVRGYYTSRAGLQELEYKGNTFHGACPGCTLKAGG